MWTNTCCSHPLSLAEELPSGGGLGCRRAAQRRLYSELGVPGHQAQPSDMVYLTRILYKDQGSRGWGEHELDYILFLRSSMDNLSLNPNPEEVQAVEWVKKDDLQEFMEDLKSRNVEVTPWFKLITKNLLPLWWEQLDKIEELQDHQTIHKYY